jgi:MFS family permease
MPIGELFRNYPRTILKAFGARVADAGTWAVFLVFGISYLTNQLGASKSLAITGAALALAAQMLVIPLAGRLCDRIGRRPVVMAGAVIVGVAVFPSFALMGTQQPFLVCAGFLIGFPIGTGLVFAPSGAFLAELFDANVRFSGTSVVFQLSSLAAGLVPAIAAALLLLGNGTPWLVCGLVALLAAVTWGCARLLPETFRRDIEQDQSDMSSVGGETGR